MLTRQRHRQTKKQTDRQTEREADREEPARGCRLAQIDGWMERRMDGFDALTPHLVRTTHRPAYTVTTYCVLYYDLFMPLSTHSLLHCSTRHDRSSFTQTDRRQTDGHKESWPSLSASLTPVSRTPALGCLELVNCDVGLRDAEGTAGSVP
mmetsp:Transcript_14902/g.35527  ORF Transcript_14902/g.35527 Transcript_14902/m.35527 type:complete len:151 (+) Transcript_14902:1008-1460(+)